ncbi:MAG: site-specific DNA-methyltransferase, partial [Candidatus Tenebribacter burtonii]|nr:site-specific DNA-methyltransferase [Candidatus Tenebribacter burtonii]
SDVWTDIHRIKHNKKRDPHPCQLPIHLLDRLILLSTDENDIVLDPFSGTGTTAISAKRLGRNFIGFELDQEYVNISKEKLNFVKPNFKLGDSWLSFYLNNAVTIRNKDWNNLKEFYDVPEPAKIIDYKAIKLKDKKLIPTSSYCNVNVEQKKKVAKKSNDQQKIINFNHLEINRHQQIRPTENQTTHNKSLHAK